MPLRHCRHIIFDLDGTLTIPVHDFESIREELGLEEGQLILETLDEMSPEEAKRMLERLDSIEHQLAEKAQPQPRVQDVLEYMISMNISIGILTRNGEAIARTTLEACGLFEFFSDTVIVGRESCAPKPDPAGVSHLLELWGASTDDTAIVGDYLFDLQSGRRAGITTVHFDPTGTFQWPEFTDVRVESIHRLVEYIG